MNERHLVGDSNALPQRKKLQVRRTREIYREKIRIFSERAQTRKKRTHSVTVTNIAGRFSLSL